MVELFDGGLGVDGFIEAEKDSGLWALFWWFGGFAFSKSGLFVTVQSG